MGEDDCEGGDWEAEIGIGGDVKGSDVWMCEHCAWFGVLWDAALECVFVYADELRPLSSARMCFFVFFFAFLVFCELYGP